MRKITINCDEYDNKEVKVVFINLNNDNITKMIFSITMDNAYIDIVMLIEGGEITKIKQNVISKLVNTINKLLPINLELII